MSRNSAISKAEAFKLESGIGVWPMINKSQLADGLKERVNDPNKINQQNTAFCGPASFIRNLATDNPDQYVQAAIDLFYNGRADIFSLSIKPGKNLIKSPVLGDTNPADWLILASIRDSSNDILSVVGWFDASSYLSFSGITMPESMQTWFKKTGYSEVINDTDITGGDISVVKNVRAQRASRLFSKGYKVAVFVDSDMLYSKSQDNLFSLYPDHWISLNSTISNIESIGDYESPVSFNAFSWGKIISVPEHSFKPLSKGEFLHRFYGFVAAKF